MFDFQKFRPLAASAISFSRIQYPAREHELNFRRHLALQVKEAAAELDALSKFSANYEAAIKMPASTGIAAIAEIVRSELDSRRRELTLLKKALQEPFPAFKG